MEVDEPQDSASSKCTKRGKAKGKKVCLPYRAEMNTRYQTEEFKSCLKKSLCDGVQMNDGKGIA